MGVELILGMEEVINYLKQLEEENKKLKEDLEKAWDQRGDKWRKARIKNLEEENKKLKEDNDEWMKKFTEFSVKQKEIEFKELKEQNECLQRQIESVCKANDKLKEENKELKEDLWKLAFNEESDEEYEEPDSP